MKRNASPINRLVLAVALAVLATACSREGSQASAAAAPPPPSVGVFVAQAADIPLVTELPGRTAPYLIAEVRPQVTGLVKQRAFKEGSEVKAGELLYQIDPATYKAAHDTAKAGLARAEANLTAAKLKASRYAGLAKIDAVSQQANDDAIAALKLAEADVAAARASIEQARIDLEFTRLASPIAGRIGRSTVTAGALVTANQAQALATVQQLNPIYVDLTQSSAELLRLRSALEAGRLQQAGTVEMPVSLVLEDGTEYAQPGKLAFSEVSVDPATGSVTLRAVFPNPDGVLLPGMYVRAHLEQAVANNAILIPHAGLTRDARGRAIAMVVGSDDTVEERSIKAERSIGDQWVVTEGLAAGERIIVEGLQKVRSGGKVSVQVAGAAGAAPAN
ncbi:MAG TPA: efflux RND transporter periplasmic adaptor subunit [Rhodocyclaceae bacterium]|nr:efflux RND transporter periplasmic adaptor subunit [Rhodocyclaceae bacterium]